jgi:glycosyltransferase involved in cell wall biosynthesis
MAEPDLTVIIPTFNRYELLAAAVASVAAQAVDDAALEIVVVDNSVPPGSLEAVIAAAGTSWKLTCLTEPVPGLSRARNIGVAAAAAAVVAFIDDDALAEPGWAAEIVGRFRADAELGVLGGPVKPIWPDAYPAWLDPKLDGFFTVLDLGGAPRELRRGEWFAGTNVAFRKSALLAAGGFSEQLGRVGQVLLSNEEIAVSNRITAAGFKLLYTPDMVVQHLIHKERIDQAWLRQRAFWQVISDIISAPLADATDKAACVKRVNDFLQLLPARYRGVEALFIDVSEPRLFGQQIGAIGAFVRLMASAASDWGEPPR